MQIESTKRLYSSINFFQGLALLTLSWDKNWDSHSLVNGYPSFYPRIALVAPSPGEMTFDLQMQSLLDLGDI